MAKKSKPMPHESSRDAKNILSRYMQSSSVDKSKQGNTTESIEQEVGLSLSK